MSKDKWDFLEAYLKDFGLEGRHDVHPAIMSVVAKEIEDALMSRGRIDLATANDALLKAFRRVHARSGNGVRRVSDGELDADPVLQEAYSLGQLAMAQKMAALALERRLDHPTHDLADLWNNNATRELAGRVSDAGHRMTRSPAGEIVFALESGYYLLIVDNLRSERRYQADREEPFAVVWASDAMVLADIDEPVAFQGEFATAEEALAFACERIGVEWKVSAPGNAT